MKKSQTTVIGAILIFVIATVGIVIFYEKINSFMKKASKEAEIPQLNAFAIDVTKALDDVIKFKSRKEVLFTAKNTLLTLYAIGNFTDLVVFTNLPSDTIEIEPITTNNYYREICKIDNNNELRGCYFEGYKLENLTNFCSVYNSNNLAMNNNLYYCYTGRAYTIIKQGGIKYLVSIYPSPRINLRGNDNLCNAYLVNLKAKKAYLFVCDFWIEENNCYFPVFEGQAAAYNNEGENRKIIFSYGGLRKIPNIYPFCKESFAYVIRVSAQ